MLLNCDELKWNLPDIVAALDRGDLTYETLMYDMAVARSVRAAIDPSWNSLERYVPGRRVCSTTPTCPLSRGCHWTIRTAPSSFEISSPPWIPASSLGRISRSTCNWVLCVPPCCAAGHRVEWSERLSKEARAMDARFVPPYKQMESGSARGGLGGRVHGLLRRVLGAIKPAEPALKE